MINIGGQTTSGYLPATKSDQPMTKGQLNAPTGATEVGISDAGSYFTGTNVEAALQELGASAPSGLGTMSTQDANNVAITGGSITGITDLAIADGGTGASTAAGARTNLGLGAVAVEDVVTIAEGGTGATTASAARTALGVTATGADTTYNYRANNLSDVANTSTARTNLGLGSVAIENTVPVSKGGTGSTTAAAARTALGVTATGADTTYAYRANNLNDLGSASTARSNLGVTSTSDLASTATGKGASLIGVEDASGYFSATQVEAVLAEIHTQITAAGKLVYPGYVSSTASITKLPSSWSASKVATGTYHITTNVTLSAAQDMAITANANSANYVATTGVQTTGANAVLYVYIQDSSTQSATDGTFTFIAIAT